MPKERKKSGGGVIKDEKTEHYRRERIELRPAARRPREKEDGRERQNDPEKQVAKKHGGGAPRKDGAREPEYFEEKSRADSEKEREEDFYRLFSDVDFHLFQKPREKALFPAAVILVKDGVNTAVDGEFAAFDRHPPDF